MKEKKLTPNEEKTKKEKRQKIIKIFKFSLPLAFIFATIVTIFLMYNPHPFSKTYTYNDFGKNEVSYTEVLKQQEYEYFVFLYKDDCTACHNVEKQVTDYILKYNSYQSKRKLYLYNMIKERDLLVEFNSDGTPKVNYYVKDIADLRISSVPTLLLIRNNMVEAAVEGSNAIIQQLSQ